MGEVAGMAARFLGLRFIMLEQLIDLLRQGPDLGREILANPGFLTGADRGDFTTNAPQRPKPVEGLKSGEDEEADAEREEAPEQSGAKPVDLQIDRLARLGDLEAPAH